MIQWPTSYLIYFLTVPEGSTLPCPSLHRPVAVAPRALVCRTVARFPMVADEDDGTACTVGELEAVQGQFVLPCTAFWPSLGAAERSSAYSVREPSSCNGAGKLSDAVPGRVCFFVCLFCLVAYGSLFNTGIKRGAEWANVARIPWCRESWLGEVKSPADVMPSNTFRFRNVRRNSQGARRWIGEAVAVNTGCNIRWNT